MAAAPSLTEISYVINYKAQKALYKTMAKNKKQLTEPKDLSKEWHSDGGSSGHSSTY